MKNYFNNNFATVRTKATFALLIFKFFARVFEFIKLLTLKPLMYKKYVLLTVVESKKDTIL